jgi:hypothetical protein
MDSKEIKSLFEAYSAVYNQDLRDTIEEENLSFVDDLTDSELNIVVEEVIDELIEEGHEFDDVENIFEEVMGEELDILEEIEFVSEYLQECGLNEYGVYQVLNNPDYYDVVDALFEAYELTEARRSGRIEPVTKTGKSIGSLKGGAKSAAIRSKKTAKATRDTGVERPSQMTAALKSQSKTVAANKPEIKAKVTKVKATQPKAEPKSDNVKDTTASSAWLKSRREQRAAKRQSAEIKAGEAKAKERVKNIANIRKEKEAAVASKGAEAKRRARNIRNIRLGKAVRKGIAKAQVSAYNKGREIAQSAKDTVGRLTQSAKNRMTVAKRGIKRAIAGAASKVASGASKVASRMSEEVDVYDIILSYLLDEGYAETSEAAEKIMVNMSEEWRDEIIEATYSAKSARSGKDIGKPGKQFEKIAKEAGERYGSKERGEKVAGAVLDKLRAKKG